MDDQRAAYVALALTPGLGPVRLRTLLDACHTPLGACSAPFAFLCALPKFSRATATAVKATSPRKGRQVMDEVEAIGAQIIVPSDSSYPASLGAIPDPPTLLFARGDLSLLERPAVAIVGSRNHSAYGAEVCHIVATTFARAGGVVVSGMARGLDAVAHAAALNASGGTIGVLGNGLGVIYPAANRALYEQVGTHGLLITEFPPGERPHAGSFPRRNRLISGLAGVTIVIEAAQGSGALITADAALEQGREVMAVPGPITSVTSVGTNRLIRDGAAPFLEPADLFTHYPELTLPTEPALSATPTSQAVLARSTVPRPLPETLSVVERAVVILLGNDPLHVDEIASQAARPVHEVLATLSNLEIAGIIEQRPGRLFRRT